ncbi:putative ubiquitin-associated protein [Helianthus annuus]|uniref:Putative UBA-like protein n=1 Tax=Helianthus annuus TaxID=4232 RepID=A0A251UF97_HELAN|nr:putative ubiquitin-associated protein [Helianthus annuus]KAJ0906503.1 putative ubiquitin-associated protein [Helianthus annuus]
MDYYDFRNRLNSQSSSSSPHPMASLYPKIGHPPPPRNNATASPSSGMGIRVTLKPEFRITPPPQMYPHIGEIPRSTFQFDFELERKILAEAEKENPNWSNLGLENLPRETAKPISRANSSASVDPVVGKYTATGLNRDAVSIAVAKYGDNPIKVREFVSGYMVLREMGFEANRVAEALFAHDNDKEAAAHFLTTSSS